MQILQPFISNKKGTRRFACSAVALQAVVVCPEETTLILSSPTRHSDGAWQVVSSALEAGETVLEGTLREAHKELGGDVRLRALGTVHVQTFHYDENIQYMIAIYYLLAYEGGEVHPGDDMQDSQYRWWSVAELDNENINIVVPRRSVSSCSAHYKRGKSRHDQYREPAR
jgi:ADP-ribose pyrophosphatase YjhB (NUDIX family)